MEINSISMSDAYFSDWEKVSEEDILLELEERIDDLIEEEKIFEKESLPEPEAPENRAKADADAQSDSDRKDQSQSDDDLVIFYP
jgi:hypothetical protein